jgi:hypothetical protein
VQIAAPAIVAMGIARRGGNPKEVFIMAERYPPTPINNAPPRETRPTKWAKRSKLTASRA